MLAELVSLKHRITEAGQVRNREHAHGMDGTSLRPASSTTPTTGRSRQLGQQPEIFVQGVDGTRYCSNVFEPYPEMHAGT